MKIAVIGTTGASGKAIADQVIRRGWTAIAVARRPEAIEIEDPRCEKRKIDFSDPGSVEKALRGADVVVSALGQGGLSASAQPTTLYSDSVRALIQAMKQLQIKRLLVLSSGGTDFDEKSPWFYRALLRPYLINNYLDMIKMETILEESRDLEWTVVRPTYLLDGPPRRYLVKDRRMGGGSFKIHRVDVADFVVREIEEKAWVRGYPTLGYP